MAIEKKFEKLKDDSIPKKIKKVYETIEDKLKLLLV